MKKFILNMIFWDDGHEDSTRVKNVQFTWPKMKEITQYLKDNGVGISKDHIEKIFDKLYRVPTGNLHNVKGFGLGLYLVQQLLKAHDSKILVKSEEGVGSEFVIRIPIQVNNNE